MVNPSHEHIQKSLHIVKYVSSTLKAKLHIAPQGEKTLKHIVMQIRECIKMIENQGLYTQPHIPCGVHGLLGLCWEFPSSPSEKKKFYPPEKQ